MPCGGAQSHDSAPNAQRHKRGRVRGARERTSEVELGVLGSDILSRNVDELDTLHLGKAVESSVQVLQLLELRRGVLLRLSESALREHSHKLVKGISVREILLQVLDNDVESNQVGVAPTGERLYTKREAIRVSGRLKRVRGREWQKPRPEMKKKRPQERGNERRAETLKSVAAPGLHVWGFSFLACCFSRSASSLLLQNTSLPLLRMS